MTDSNSAGGAGAFYERLGVSPIINAAGSITRLGGTRTRPETLELMSQAARVMVNIEDLNRAAGKELARLTGAEAGFVCSGAAGGLVLQAAAVITGNDRVKMRQLPNTDGLKNEIIIHTMHRFPYDQAYRAAGARMVEFGDYLFAHPLAARGGHKRVHRGRRIPLCSLLQQQGDALGKRLRNCPRPRRAGHRRRRFHAAAPGQPIPLPLGGSRHGGLQWRQGNSRPPGHRHTGWSRRPDRGSRGTGQPSPQFLGRGMKVAKEEVIGLVASLAAFVEEDEAAEMETYRAMAQKVVDALVELPGLRVTLEHDGINYLIPHAVIRFTDEWRGPSRDAVAAAMERGVPQVYLHQLGGPQELAVDPLNLTEEETETVIRRLRDELTR